MNQRITTYGQRTSHLNATSARVAQTADRTNALPQCSNCKRYVPAGPGRCPVCGQRQ